EAVQEGRAGVRGVDDPGICTGNRIHVDRVIGDAARRPLGAAVAGHAVGAGGGRGAEDGPPARRVAAPARRGGGASGHAPDVVLQVRLLRRAATAGRAEVADVRVGIGDDTVPVDVGVGRDEAAAAEDAARVELEVLVLVAHGGPVERVLIGQPFGVAEGAVE